MGLIYLTSIVYIPIKRELSAGFETDPVMCTSVLAEKVACTKNISCFEWCMADPGQCPSNPTLSISLVLFSSELYTNLR